MRQASRLTLAQQRWFEERSPRVQVLSELEARCVRHRPLGILHADGTFDSYWTGPGDVAYGSVAVGIEDMEN
ncbi:MAG TPA: hypothetical protein V6D20_19305 [Candidatus Obscuribacterales bacterium]